MKLNTELRYDVQIQGIKLTLYVSTTCPKCDSRLTKGKIGLANTHDEWNFEFSGWKCGTHGTTTPNYRTTSDDTNEQNPSA